MREMTAREKKEKEVVEQELKLLLELTLKLEDDLNSLHLAKSVN